MKRFPSPRCASATNIVRPLESTAETQPQLQPALLVLFVRIVCLPDERHIPGSRCAKAIVDLDRVRAGYLNEHRVDGVEVHNVGSRCEAGSIQDGRGAVVIAGPYHAAAGNML